MLSPTCFCLAGHHWFQRDVFPLLCETQRKPSCRCRWAALEGEISAFFHVKCRPSRNNDQPSPPQLPDTHTHTHTKNITEKKSWKLVYFNISFRYSMAGIVHSKSFHIFWENMDMDGNTCSNIRLNTHLTPMLLDELRSDNHQNRSTLGIYYSSYMQ